ncbi:MAG: hypothetical protein ACFFB5_09250 [Promethearchaeota archaeon]
MSKTQRHQHELHLLFSEFLQTGDKKKVTKYLLDNSNLPGRRANLELAKAFTKVIEENWDKNEEILWSLITSLIKITSNQAPVNDPQEFLPFCATWALGSIGAISKVHYTESLQFLRELSKDSRWRIREAVAKGIHRLIKERGLNLLEELQTWIVTDQWLPMRAVVTGVAEPSVLKDNHIINQALELHKEVLNQVRSSKNRKTDDFKALRKGLAYSLSVVVQSTPEDGFKYLEKLIGYEDEDILWILKQNLGKNRLIKNYPVKVNALNKKLRHSNLNHQE